MRINMSYSYSQIDKSNMDWFKKDDSRATLLSIELMEGNLRGLSPFKIEFNYPISVIAGKNGTGKSTLLAMAACAYHNNETGYKLSDRNKTYYTFQDFFVQSSEEIPLEGIKIMYYFLHNNWRKSSTNPDTKGIKPQIRTKKKGGKWNDYDVRIKRNVVYYGINRIVPPNEKSVSKSYKKLFENNNDFEWTTSVSKVVGRILGKSYNEFQIYNYNRYKLPIVKCNRIVYSGFNMGAGENALFEIFSTIYSLPSGSMIIIDEIELGLHGEAQGRLIYELKELCKERRMQILCTTHSKIILESVPPEGRFFIENYEGKTIVIPEIATDYAGAKLLGKNSNELNVFVEDSVAEKIIEQSINSEHRKRIIIHRIGSAPAIARQLAATYKLSPKPNCLALLDGDQSNKKTEIINSFIKYLESSDNIEAAKQWVNNKIDFLLNSDVWPEKCIMEMFKEIDKTEFLKEHRTELYILDAYIEEAILSGKHNEFHTLSKKLGCNADFLLRDIVNKVNKYYESDFNIIRKKIDEHLL